MDKPRIYMENGYWKVKANCPWWRTINPNHQAAHVFCDRRNYMTRHLGNIKCEQDRYWAIDPFPDPDTFFNQRQIDLRDALRNNQ